MGYDLKAVRGDTWYSANSTLMELLRAAIVESGVRLDRHRVRRRDPSFGGEPIEGDLMMCFGSNSGFLVTPAEALEIALKVEKALPRWVARPKVVKHKEVLVYPKEWDERGKVTAWGEAYPIDPSAPPAEAAEIGAAPRSVELVEKFVGFCRKASRQGGFYVY